MKFVLIISMAIYGHAGMTAAVSSVPGFDSREACERAAAQYMRSVEEAKLAKGNRVWTVCVEAGK